LVEEPFSAFLPPAVTVFGAFASHVKPASNFSCNLVFMPWPPEELASPPDCRLLESKSEPDPRDLELFRNENFIFIFFFFFKFLLYYTLP
jgi:hypothetical protein